MAPNISYILTETLWSQTSKYEDAGYDIVVALCYNSSFISNFHIMS